MLISDEDLLGLAQTIWSSILGMDLAPGNPEDAKVDNDAVIATVQVTGEWEGAITVRCSWALATRMAAAMFELEADELSDEEIRDAMGELANMTGGNVKGIAPGTNTLTLPTVGRGDETTVTISKAKRINLSVGWCDDEPVVFTVLSPES